jgi:Na+-translocating ferredoxin:NAD+ oxidoreductase RnfG subunit
MGQQRVLRIVEAITVAVIAAVGGVLAALVQSMRKENRDDHAIVSDSLNRIETKLDNHIDDHLKGDI